MSLFGIDRLQVQKIETFTGVAIGENVFRRSYDPNNAASGAFQFSWAAVTGDFSALSVNIEFSPNGTDSFEVVAVWTPLTEVGSSSCSEAGYYRLNCTLFTDGTSFDAYVQVIPGGAGSGGGGGATGDVNIFDSAGNDLNSTAGALNVAVVSGGGSNPSVGTTGTTAPTSATEIGIIDGSGDLQGASGSNPVPVTDVASASTGNSPSQVSVDISSTQILASNTSRKGVNVTNMSYATVSLGFGSDDAEVYYGIILGPGGTFWMDGLDFTTAAINAISDGSATPVYLTVQEWQ